MAAEELKAAWPIEDIPDTDQLFKRVHRKLFKLDGTIMTGAFSHTDLSVDWAKYSTSEKTRNRAENPEHNAVVQLCVGAVREIPGQSVIHVPICEDSRPGSPGPNRAHSHITGKKNLEARVKLRRLVTTVLLLREC